MSQNTCSLLEAEKKLSYSRMTLGAVRSVFVRRSQKTAIKEMCRQCMGSLPEVAGCRGDTCALWMYRPGANRGKLPDWVVALRDAGRLKVSAKAAAAGKRLAGARKGA